MAPMPSIAGALPSRADGMRVVIALGGNRLHGRLGRPRHVLAAAVAALAAGGLQPLAVARVRETVPMGPGSRRYANAALLGLWKGPPAALLALCQQTERAFGRRRGRRWGDRVLDCDILLMGETVVAFPGLVVPHPGLADRAFVLDPLVELWPGWRHPLVGLTARHLRARLRRPRPVD